jgi:hypothetical protein
MRDVIEEHIFSFYLPMVGVALAIQLIIAGIIIRMTKDTMDFTAWSDDESRAFYNKRKAEEDFSA